MNRGEAILHIRDILENYTLEDTHTTYNILKFNFSRKGISLTDTFITTLISMAQNCKSGQKSTFGTLLQTAIRILTTPLPPERQSIIHKHTSDSVISITLSKYDYYFTGTVYTELDNMFVANRYCRFVFTDEINIEDINDKEILRFIHYRRIASDPDRIKCTQLSSTYVGVFNYKYLQLRIWNLHTNVCEAILFSTQIMKYRKTSTIGQIIIKLYNTLILWNFLTGAYTCILKQKDKIDHFISINEKIVTVTGNVVTLFPGSVYICDFPVQKLIQLPDGHLLIQGRKEHNIWDLDTLTCESQSVNPLISISKDKRSLIIKDQCILQGHEDSIIDFILIPGNKVISAGHDNTIRIWNINTKSCEYVLKDQHNVLCIQCVDQSNFIICRHNSGMELWNIVSGHLMGNINSHERLLDGRLLTVVDKKLHLWNLDTLESKIIGDDITNVISMDGHIIINHKNRVFKIQ